MADTPDDEFSHGVTGCQLPEPFKYGWVMGDDEVAVVVNGLFNYVLGQVEGYQRPSAFLQGIATGQP
jgi:hypothetical protein